eukprot:10849297-Alexandrium_andersonii.AAC.1
MSASLVGSEMCIRDRRSYAGKQKLFLHTVLASAVWTAAREQHAALIEDCLLYTSDAADDM